MGEAKRRKKLNKKYGKLKSLTTKLVKEREITELIDELNYKYHTDIQRLIKSKKIPDDYQEIQGRIAPWLKEKILIYQEKDRQTIAAAIMFFFTKGYEIYDEISVYGFVCFGEILRDYLPQEQRATLTKLIKDVRREIKIPESIVKSTPSSDQKISEELIISEKFFSKT